MKTIKELADELGVSKTAVMKKIDNRQPKTANQKVGDSEELISSLLEQLKAKDLQLAKKDEQIEALQNQMIQTTAALLAAQESVKAAQALHAIDRKEDVLAIEGDQEEKDLNRKWWQFWK